MADQILKPQSGALAATPAAQGRLQSFDVSRFGMEVAHEIGVDPNNLGAYGLSPDTLRKYESQLHSGTQNGGSR